MFHVSKVINVKQSVNSALTPWYDYCVEKYSLCAANFRLPEQGEHFDEVRYIELNEEESRPLVEQYNKEGRAAGYGQSAPFSGQGKKFRPNDRPPFRGGGGGGGGGGFRGGRGGGGRCTR